MGEQNKYTFFQIWNKNIGEIYPIPSLNGFFNIVTGSDYVSVPSFTNLEKKNWVTGIRTRLFDLYTDTFPENKVCQQLDYCSLNGVCKAGGVCECVSGWSGPNCEAKN